MMNRSWLLLLIGMVVLSPILYAIAQHKGPTLRSKPAPQQLQPQQKSESAPPQHQPQQKSESAPPQHQPQQKSESAPPQHQPQQESESASPQFQPQHRLSCDSKLKQTSSTDSPHLLLVAAAPGSGNDWMRLTFTLLTGIPTKGNRNLDKMKDVSQLHRNVNYYGSHYPYLSTEVEMQVHIREHADRLVVILRNPSDAAFSEYTSQYVLLNDGETQASKTGKKRTSKYNKLNLLTVDDYLAVDKSSGKQNIPSEAVVSHFEDYLERWKFFYKYWLDEYKGSFKLYLYKDLEQNNLLFLDMANYFGFGADTNAQKEHQEQCLLQYMETASKQKRPATALLNNAKMIIKEYFTAECLEAKTYVEELLKKKYQKDIIIN